MRGIIVSVMAARRARWATRRINDDGRATKRRKRRTVVRRHGPSAGEAVPQQRPERELGAEVPDAIPLGQAGQPATLTVGHDGVSRPE
jgi:hypothetical protein